MKNNKEIVKNLISEFYPYAKRNLGFDKNIKIILKDDIKNAENPLGKTAYYSPTEYKIVVFITQRHPKDILRSLSHELVHHTQNCRGEFSVDMTTEEGYAQEDKHLREMEREAYETGNLLLRDYEDMKKNNDLKETIYKKHNKIRTKIFDNRNEQLYKILKEDAVSSTTDFDSGITNEPSFTDTTVRLPKQAAPVMAQWHSGVEDPIYKVALLTKEEKDIPTELLQEAGVEFENLLENVYDSEQQQELQKIIEMLRTALQTAGRDQELNYRKF